LRCFGHVDLQSACQGFPDKKELEFIFSGRKKGKLHLQFGDRKKDIKMMKPILILLSLFCVCSAHALVNGDFESGNTGFTVGGYANADTSVAGGRYDFRTESP